MKDCKKKSKEELREEVKELSQEFENGLEKLFQSDEYIQFLSVMAKRPRYSLRNNLLIFLQNPDATFVSGYKTFLNNYGHQVQKGERGIRILAPIVHKSKKKKSTDNDFVLIEMDDQKQEEKEDTYVSLRVDRVFDISQTKTLTVTTENGEIILSPKAQKLIDSLSYLDIAEIIAEDESYTEKLLTAITDAVPIPVRYNELRKGLGGYFSFKDKDDLHIVLNSLYSGANLVETLVHEWAHYALHNPYGENSEDAKKTKNSDKEIQAESISYIVLKHFGIDASCEALKYVASWSISKTTDDLKNSMSLIQKTAAEMITIVENGLSKEYPLPVPEETEDWRTA